MSVLHRLSKMLMHGTPILKVDSPFRVSPPAATFGCCVGKCSCYPNAVQKDALKSSMNTCKDCHVSCTTHCMSAGYIPILRSTGPTTSSQGSTMSQWHMI
jgi:hypothetical protein